MRYMRYMRSPRARLALAAVSLALLAIVVSVVAFTPLRPVVSRLIHPRNSAQVTATVSGPTATLTGETATLAGLTFNTKPYPLLAWPDARGPYYPRPPDYDGPRDAEGVRIYTQDTGAAYQHPVAQAMDGLQSLATYYDTHSLAEFSNAVSEAQRLISIHTEDKAETPGAWWYPYDFTYALYGDPNDTNRPPWYSGMAQGQALDLFTQLYLLTHEARWRTAADATFTSFLYPYRSGITGKNTPWAWHVSAGYAWIEEYPTPQPDDHTMNGFGFALWGLITYARAFGDARATTLAQGGLTTFLYAAQLVRHPGQISGYSVSHQTPIPYYHGVVTGQLAVFSTVTGDSRFAAMAANFADDFPIPDAGGAVEVSGGAQIVATVNEATLAPTEISVETIPTPTQWAADMRVRLRDQEGYWYHLKDGPYANKYLHESSKAYLPGVYNTIQFAPSGVSATFPAGAYSVYRATGDGSALLQTSRLTFTSPRNFAINAHMTIAGVTVWRIANAKDAASMGGSYIASPTEPLIG